VQALIEAIRGQAGGIGGEWQDEASDDHQHRAERVS